jgi:hypothetical protein
VAEKYNRKFEIAVNLKPPCSYDAAPSHIKALLEDIVAEIPEYGPDDRQEVFFTTIKNIKKNTALKINSVIGTRGFPAAFVDLGFLQHALLEIIMRGDNGKDTALAIQCFLSRAIQRLIKLQFNIKPKEKVFDVKLISEDDYGVYKYDFFLVLPDSYFKTNVNKKEKI